MATSALTGAPTTGSTTKDGIKAIVHAMPGSMAHDEHKTQTSSFAPVELPGDQKFLTAELPGEWKFTPSELPAELYAEVPTQYQGVIPIELPAGLPVGQSMQGFTGQPIEMPAEVLPPPVTRRIPNCSNCRGRHNPRRFIICVDGMREPGEIVGRSRDSNSGKTSSIYRVYRMAKLGLVMDGNTGQLYEQIPVYFPSVGVDHKQPLNKTQVASNQSESLQNIINVYRHICERSCSGWDEIFFFGYSTGAYVVRAVASILHHYQCIIASKDETDGNSMASESSAETGRNFRTKFEAGWELFLEAPQRASNKYSAEMEQERTKFLRNYTRPSPRIRMMGLIDTNVMRRTSAWVNVLDKVNENVESAFQALAFNESRLPYDGLHLGEASYKDKTSLEAYFFGTRRDLSGKEPENGLSLWPLQWLLSEARQKGLCLNGDMGEDAGNDFAKMTSKLIWPQPVEYGVHFNNGVKLNMWDISSTFEKKGHNAVLSKVVESERNNEMFADGILKSSSGQAGISKKTQFFWENDESMKPKKFRILIAGNTKVGKSTLINLIFGAGSAEVNATKQTDHNIETELHSGDHWTDSPMIIHDSRGFSSGDVDKLTENLDFIAKRSTSTNLNERLHCIWYCIEATNLVKDNALEKLLDQNFKLWHIPIIVVYTKYKSYDRVLKGKLSDEYEEELGEQIPFELLEKMFQKEREEIRQTQDDHIMDIWKKAQGELEARRDSVHSNSNVSIKSTHKNKFRTHRVDKFDRDSRDELIKKTISIVDQNVEELLISAQTEFLGLKVQAAVRLCTNLLEKSKRKSFLFAQLHKRIFQKEVKSDIVLATLQVFSWDLSPDIVRGFMVDPLGASEEEFALTTKDDDAVKNWSVGMVMYPFMYNQMKTERLQAWLSFLVCIVVIVNNVYRKCRSERPPRNAVYEDFLERLPTSTIQDIKRRVGEEVGMDDCVVEDYSKLADKAIVVALEFTNK